MPMKFPASRLLMRLRKLVRNDQLVLSFLALVVGLVGGGAVIGLREAIGLVQTMFYGSGTERLSEYAASLPWWHLLLAPAAGGLMIGLFIKRFLPGGRPQGVADVIEASALRGGRMSVTTGIRAALVNAASIGVGASVGREGPAVHLGAALAGGIAKRLHLTRSLSRTLLGCGVATAVAASFNAPIAGALFASEVVVGHYALSAFAPIVIASVTGTVISRAYFGDFPAFIIAAHPIATFWELPVFAGLGLVIGLAALVLMRGIFFAAAAARRLPVPSWVRPALGGLMVGAIAVAFPQVLGVGYGATDSALLLTFPLWLLLAIGVAKIAATGVSIGFGFGGGVFSPSLVIGAMLGAAYGLVAAAAIPGVITDASAYTVVGMGAMAAAVLGAPISTTLIIFEMTGDYALTLGVMVAVVLASVLTKQMYGNTFFTAQLEQRGLDIKSGFETALLRGLKVRDVMSRESELVSLEVGLQELRIMLQTSRMGELFVVRDDGGLFGTITLADLSEVAFDHDFDTLINAGDVARMHPPILSVGDDLEAALKIMRDTGEEHIAVVENSDTMIYLGCVHERSVMGAYNRALLESRREEHG